nr:4-(cytidine 5'-diphospho)-2-C-methyl-D-erythritol kinase [Arthrobacter sp. UM1]
MAEHGPGARGSGEQGSGEHGAGAHGSGAHGPAADASPSEEAPEASSGPVTALAPGKINVGLRVGPKRADGYHGLASVFLAVSLEEKAALTGRPSRSVQLELDPASDSRLGLDGVPLTEDNVAWKAVAAVADAVEAQRESADGGAGSGTASQPIPGDAPSRLSILKRVPIAGGMGGGSADAAAALVAANEAAGRPLSPQGLHEAAARIGADVPFALHGGAAVGLGVGDRLAPVACERPLYWVLVPSDRGLSTPQVFTRLDELRAARGEEAEEPAGADPALVEALAAGDPERLATLLHNDLQEAALDLAPELGEVLAAGREAGALAGIVSGSGPTVALLAAGPESADLLAARLAERGWDRAAAVAGPAPGARLADSAL